MTVTIEVPGDDLGADSSSIAATASEIDVARAVAEPLAARVKRPAAQVRASFIQGDRGGPPPPLARLLRGGRGGEVKLKVLLSILWVAVKEPHDVTLPARVWAELAGLPDPGGRGAHRVNSALRQLVKSGHLRAELRPGEPSRLSLLDETGSGAAYTNPGLRITQLKEAKEDFSAHRYVQVPTALWVQGWIAALHGPGLAMLLVLLAQASGRDHQNLWFSPGFADERFHLSEETRKRGLDQLRDLGLVTVKKRPLSRSPLEVTRVRNTYTLDLKRLASATPDSHE